MRIPEAMADNKMSTLILEVDLHCPEHLRKIRKILCDVQGSSREAEFMKIISYDEGSRKVTITWRFDPEKLSKKLKCKGRKVIESVEVVRSESEANDVNAAAAVAPPPPWCCWPCHGGDCRCFCSGGRVVAYGVPICCHVPHNATYFCHEDPSAACSVM